MPDQSSVQYDAFISYSRAVDGKLAPSLQDGLRRFAKPWYRRRALHVFRDDASLSANPALWTSIQKAISASEFFILLASPDAAHSEWVNREVTQWLEVKSHLKLLIALTDGSLVWNPESGDFDWERSTALPPALRGVFEQEPRYADLRWARSNHHLSLQHAVFRDNVGDLAATLQGRPKDELMGEDVRQHHRTMRLTRIVVVTLLFLTVGLGVASVVASRQRNLAEQQRDEALRSQSLYLGRLSGIYLGYGHTASAVRLALQALPADLGHPDRPYVRGAEIELYRALSRNFELLTLREHDDTVFHAAFSPGGGTIVTASWDGTAILWDAGSGVRIRTLETHDDAVSFASFSPDGRQVLSASMDGTARLWDAVTGRMTHVLEHEKAVWPAAFSPDGARLVTVSGETVRLWGTQAGELQHTLHGHGDRIGVARFSPAGEYLITASSIDRTTRLWNVETGEELHQLVGYEGVVRRAAFNPNGSLVAGAATDGTTRVWNVASGEPVLVLPTRDGKAAYGLAFSPDGSRIATGSQAGAVQLWDATTGHELHDLKGHTGEVVQVAFAPGGGLLVTASFDDTARIWDVQTGSLVRVLEGHVADIQHAAFSPNGRRILTAAWDGTARVWDAEVPEPDPVFKGHDAPVDQATFSPEGTRLVTVSSDETSRLWEAATGRLLHVLDQGHGWIRQATFSPDGGQLVTRVRQGADLGRRERRVAAGPRARVRLGDARVVRSCWGTGRHRPFGRYGRVLECRVRRTGAHPERTRGRDPEHRVQPGRRAPRHGVEGWQRSGVGRP